MFIQVRASNPPHPGTYTPGRFWPNGVTRKLEVVEDSVAEAQLGPDVPAGNKKPDPAIRRLKVAEGPFLPDGQPDPERITKSGMAFIRDNQHLSTLGDGETQNEMTQAAVDAVRAELARVSAELVDAKVEIGMLAEENAKLIAQVAELSEGGKTKGKKSDKSDNDGSK